MRSIFSIFKNSLRTIAVIVSLVFVCLYIAAHYNLSGYLVKNIISDDISQYLGTEVYVDNAEVDIFNQIVLEQLLVKDLDSDTLLFARRAKVSFNLFSLLQKQLKIHSIHFIDFDINLSRKDSVSDPNYKFIVDLLTNSNNDNNRLNSININSVLMRNGSVSYDNHYEPRINNGIDKNHLQLNNISSNLKISSSNKAGLQVKIKRLAFDEQSGLSVIKSSALLSLDPEQKQLLMTDLSIECQQILQNSRLATLQLEGNASYANRQVDADITSLSLNVPSMLNIDAEGSLAEAFSKHQPMSFVLRLHDFSISNEGMRLVLSKRFAIIPQLVEDQLHQIDDLKVKAYVEGCTDQFNYTVALNTKGQTVSDVQATGSYEKNNPYNCEIDARFINLLFKEHEYEYVKVNGTMNDEGFMGNLSIDDALCDMDVQGIVDFLPQDKTARLNAHLSRFSPFALHLTTLSGLENVNMSANISTDMHFGDIRHPLGKMSLDSLLLSKEDKRLLIPYLTARATRETGSYKANAKSDLFDLTYFEDESKSVIKGIVNEEQQLSEILSLPISILQESDFFVEFGDDNRLSNASVNIAEADYKGNKIKAKLSTTAETDNLCHILSFNYTTPKVRFSTLLNATSTKTPLSIDISPCQFQLNDSLIDCKGITIAKIDDNTYDLKQFDVSSNHQRVKAEGIISTEGKNNLTLHIENLGLDSLFNMLGKTYLRFGGIGTGDIVYSTDSVTCVKTEKLFIKDFSYLSGVIGDTHLDAYYDMNTNRIELDADILSANNEDHSRISGYVKRGKIDSLDLIVDANTMRVDFLNHWLNRFLHNFKGEMTGQLHLFGPARRLNLVGKPYLDAVFTNNLVGSRFNLRDHLLLTADSTLENGLIAMNNVKVYDKFGQTATVNASIRHQYLLKYNYDVQIDMPRGNNGFLLFDKPTHFNNETYWGQLYTSGNVVLRGGDGKHRVDVGVRTEKKSYFNLSPGEENYADNGYNFLTFRDKKEFEASETLDYSDINTFFEHNVPANNDTYIELSL